MFNVRIRKMKLMIQGYNLVMGSFACPQQFDVFDPSGIQVGYIRIRHGNMTVHCPDYGNLVLECPVNGDGMLLDKEQIPRLSDAVFAIQNWVLNQQLKVAHE
jgi:hypothetical protein